MVDCPLRARVGQVFDLVIDVRPERARSARPYPHPCVECYADDLIDDLGAFAVDYPPGSGLRLCAVCWSGMRARRVAHLMRAAGWDCSWWALSDEARAAWSDGEESAA